MNSCLSIQGGTIAIQSVLERPDFFTGAVFSGPSVKADPAVVTTCLVFLGKIAAWIAPSFQVLPPIDPSVISRNPGEIFKDCRHEILNELEESAASFLKDILEWIEQRLPVVLQI